MQSIHDHGTVTRPQEQRKGPRTRWQPSDQAAQFGIWNMCFHDWSLGHAAPMRELYRCSDSAREAITGTKNNTVKIVFETAFSAKPCDTDATESMMHQVTTPTLRIRHMLALDSPSSNQMARKAV